MAINYNDSRFTELKNEETQAKNQSNSTYDSLINQSSKYYDDLIAQSKDAAEKQTALQNQQTEFAIQKIEQQKDQAAKDYTKEQKGAYQDYMKQSNAYGSNMQTAGQKGLGGSGWSETIQSGFYNTYQNRYAQARENYNEIVMNYNNNIKEAELQNSSALLQIYNQAQQEQLELALQNFTVIKDLSLAKQNAYMSIDNEYNTRWRQVEAQINEENSLAEQIRQFNEELAEKKRQADMDQAYRNSQLALQRQELAQQQAQWQAEFNAQNSGGSLNDSSGGGGGSSKPTTKAKGSGGGGGTRGSSSSSTKLSNSSSIKNQYNTVAKTIQNYMARANSGTLAQKMMLKSTAKASLNKAYSDGLITKSQFTSLANKYGF